MTKKLSNLDKIIAASKMGFTSIIKGYETRNSNQQGRIVDIFHLKKFPNDVREHVVLTIINLDCKQEKWEDRMSSFVLLSEVDYKGIEVVSYEYVGHLFGEPDIPEGQRFRVKESGRIVWRMANMMLTDSENHPVWKELNEIRTEEIEPVFE